MWTTSKIITLVLLALLALLLLVAMWPVSAPPLVRYKDRASQKWRTEKVAAVNWMRWLYYNPVGKLSLSTIVKQPFLSRWIGRYMDSPASARRIAPFVKENAINMSEAQAESYPTFNAFFSRKLKANARPIDAHTKSIVSPADGKILLYLSLKDTDFVLKGYRFDVHSFLQDRELSAQFAEGAMLVVRLAPTDYHRFHAPLAAKVVNAKQIKGGYYSVSPIALHAIPQLFCLNERSYHLMHNRQIGDFVMVEVGATFVGSIVQTFEDTHLDKGEEKGYFKFGGSTVVVLFPQGSVTFDRDLIENSAQGIETSVRMGERIGVIL